MLLFNRIFCSMYAVPTMELIMKKPVLTKSMIGSTLAVTAGLSFFFTCMQLSTVGRAGASVPYADQNQRSFLTAVGVTLLLALLATGVKMMIRMESRDVDNPEQAEMERIPLPLWSMGLCVVCVALFVLQVSGLLAI